MTDSTLTGDVLIATRRVAAPIERVWTAFTTPADLTAFWGGSHAHVPAESVRIELRVGGGFELVSLPRSDASPGTVLRFRYDIVEPPGRLVFTEASTGLVTTISLTADGDTTTVTVRQHRVPVALRTEQARRGLAAILDALAQLLRPHIATRQEHP